MAEDTSLALDLPVPRSNEDHLEMFATAGLVVGSELAARIGLSLRLATGAGVSCLNDWLSTLTSHRLLADAANVAANARKVALPLETGVRQYFVAIVRSDLQMISRGLRSRGYRENQVARFKVSAWRSFKLKLREAERIRIH